MNFNATRIELELASGIADRAVAMAAKVGVEYKKQTALMDLLACHLNGCPLDLVAMKDATDAQISHDVFGIRRHLNRQTGALEDHFLPRFAYPARSVA